MSLDPRVQHVPDVAFPGHFNILRATVWPLDVTGVKVVGDYLENHRRGLPSELALVTLYDPRTGIPRAIVDATEITERRTGALTALGARSLARKDSKVLGHIGARGTAFSNVVMLDHFFDFDEIRVTSKRPESRASFGCRLEESLGKPVRVVETIEEAVVGADIVVEATRLAEPEPLLRTAWLQSCNLLVPYGTKSVLELDVLDVDGQGRRRRLGAVQARRSVRSAATARARRPARRKRPSTPSSTEVIVGAKPGRERDDERILFWHRGLATTDVSLAHPLVGRARRARRRHEAQVSR